MNPLRVDVHITGIRDQKQREALERHLQEVEGIEVHKVELARVKLTYDRDALSARDVQGEIEKMGGEVLTLRPDQSEEEDEEAA